jgi:hypothetical protein
MTKKFSIIIGLVIIAAAVVAFSLRTNNSSITAHDGMLQVEAVPLQTSSGWSYNILVGHKTFIHQEFIPAIEGQRTFATKEDAMKTADLVISKIVKGKVPSISKADLSSLGITY